MRRIAILLGAIGIASNFVGAVSGCSSADDTPRAEPKDTTSKTGKVGMRLQTRSDSGKVYQLRQAVFVVDRQGFVTPFAEPIPTTEPGGFGGFPTAGTGGKFGTAGGEVGGGFGDGGFFGAGGITASTGGIFGTGGSPIDPSNHTAVLRSDDNPNALVLETFLAPGSYQIELQPGWFMEQVDNLQGGQHFFVDAQLLSSSVQFFDILSSQETFVRYDFLVDGRRISFGDPGRLNVGIDVSEQTNRCGNGIVEPGEVCDGGDLSGQTCASVTLGSRPNGFLFCSPFCFFDTTFCEGFGGTGGAGGAGGGGGDGGGDGTGGFGGFGGDWSITR